MHKLAIVTTHPVQYNAPLFKELAKRGNLQVRVFYTWGEGCMKDKYDPGFGKVISWDIPLLDGYPFEWVENRSKNPGSHHFFGIDNPRIIDQINAFQPQTLLIFGWNFKSHLKLLRHFKNKVQILFRGDSTLLDRHRSLKSAVRKIFLRWVYTHVDKALYVGQENKKYYLAHGLKESQLVFAPHAIENSRFNCTKEYVEKAMQLRLDLGIAPDGIVFLFAGKLEPKKNPGILLKAFKNLDCAHVHLVYVGNGLLESKLRQEAACCKQVHFLDFQNQSLMPVVYRAADVVVLPSAGPGETWGLAVNEAMAAGKAVIVSNRCGCAADLVQSGMNGYIFNFDSADDLSQALAELTTKEKCAEYGRASKKLIQNFSYERICEAIEMNV